MDFRKYRSNSCEKFSKLMKNYYDEPQQKYIGGKKWRFSDNIYFKLAGEKIESSYNPKIPFLVKEIPDFLPNKNVFGLFWCFPTFKDIDSHYLFHVYDKNKIDLVISTSSGNTVEGMARTIKYYNQKSRRNIGAILIVPYISSYKVSKSVIKNNPYIKYIVLKNSTLDSVRGFALKLFNCLSSNYRVVYATPNIKTSAYAQIGLALKDNNLMNDNICYIQTVSGGVGPAGFIESAYQLKSNPEILLIQPFNGKSTPIVDALNVHSNGKDYRSIFQDGDYTTSNIEPTLGSTKPLFAIDKFIKWRESGGRILTTRINKEELFQYRNKILHVLVKIGFFPNKEVGLKLFELEKSGFIAFTGAIISANRIESNNIIVNFTGRYIDPKTIIPISATPQILYDPSDGIEPLLNLLNI